MLATGETYRDPGGDYFTRRDPERAKRRALDQLQHLGYTVTLEPSVA
jgi:transposase